MKTIIMDIIKRNFFRIIRNEVFSAQEMIEPMSQYKWDILLNIAKTHGVDAYVKEVLEGVCSENSREIPDAGMSRMYNGFLNRRLQRLREEEPLSAEPSIETLNLLDIIVQTTETILTNGLLFSNIIQIGIYLRQEGDKVDFIKLDSWLHKLMLTKMAQLEGSILIQTLGFDVDEIPFVSQSVSPSAYKLAINSLEKPICISTSDWQFRQSNGVFVESSPKAMYNTLHNCMKYFFYAPIEVASCVMGRFKMSLSNLEE